LRPCLVRRNIFEETDITSFNFYILLHKTVAVILANPFEVLFLIRHPASITAIKICST
ncbi:hypothetical protein FOCC_FOCC017321, partial [Frankliniella occidentalis]